MKSMKVLGGTVCTFKCWATENALYESAALQQEASVDICICKFV